MRVLRFHKKRSDHYLDANDVWCNISDNLRNDQELESLLVAPTIVHQVLEHHVEEALWRVCQMPTANHVDQFFLRIEQWDTASAFGHDLGYYHRRNKAWDSLRLAPNVQGGAMKAAA